MDRRALLRSVGVVGLGGMAGCLGRLDTSLSSLTEKRLYEYGQFVTHAGVRVTTTDVLRFRLVKYRRGPDGDERIWNPGPDRALVVATYRAERLSEARRDWPDWEDFHLVTQQGAVRPRIRTPDGTTIFDIIEPAGARVQWPSPRGLEGHFRREWGSVYVVERSEQSRYTVKWVEPEKPVFWMAP